MKPILLCGLLLTLVACSGAGADDGGDNGIPPVPPAKEYRNPVCRISLPDPTVIRAGDYFYLYATEDTRNTPIYRSADLVYWKYIGTAFTDQTRPTFEPNAGIWAPDINYIDGKYVLYYSMSVWGGVTTCGIGVATASSPEGPFTDWGPIIRSNDALGVTNSIDPFYIEDGDKKYLFWGSFHGIYGIELADDGLEVRFGAQKTKVAGNAYEGTYIHKRNGYYYLFASIGSCCEGVNSTYTTVVGRSQSLFGPYLNKYGDQMLNNKHEILIQGNDRFKGPGHNAEIITDSQKADWMLYHAVDVNNPQGRVLMLDRISWRDDWPLVTNSMPSTQAIAPVF